MAAPYCYEYPRPSLTVDLAVFAEVGGKTLVLLIRRKHDPFAGRWAIPGGFLEMDETAETAARRELKEETGVNHDGPVAFLGVWDAPGRDPRGRTISLAHVASVDGTPPRPTGADDAEESAWVDVETATGLAFDHDEILKAALRWRKRRRGRSRG